MLYVTTLKNFFLPIFAVYFVVYAYLDIYWIFMQEQSFAFVYPFCQVLLPTLKIYKNAYLSFILCMLKMYNNSNIHKAFA